MTTGRIRVTMCLQVKERFISPRSTLTRISSCPLMKGSAILSPQLPEGEAHSA